MELRNRLIVATFAACLSGAALAGDAPAPAADPEVARQIEAARGAVYARKSAVLQQVLALTPEQQSAFNPVYKAFDDELMALGDRRIALVKEYAGFYNTKSLDDKNAKRLVNAALDLKQEQLKLLRTYFGKASKVIGVAKAAEFIQVENAFAAAVDVKFALQVPVVGDAMKE